MTDFLKFMDDLKDCFPFHLEIYFSKVMGWCIEVRKQGCAKEYPNSPRSGDDAVICSEQNIDMELCFAKAHVAVKEWMIENNGGY